MKWKREVRTKGWGTSWALLRILHFHWQWGTQRGLSSGDWQNQHWYWEQETDEFREKETWQEPPGCRHLMLLKSASSISALLLLTGSKFSIEKLSFPDILTHFCYYAIYLFPIYHYCLSLWNLTWSSTPFATQSQGSTVTTWQTQYSFYSPHPICFLGSTWCCGSILYLTPMIQHLLGFLISLLPFLFLLLIL